VSHVKSNRLGCPECNREQATEIYNSVNVSVDPHLRNRLFNAEINVFHCRYCNHSAFLNLPLMYHDTQRRICIQFYPPELLDDPEFLGEFTPDGLPDNPMSKLMHNSRASYLTEPHVVFDMMEMLRYIQFRERLYEINQ
jgi:hypothetical protein